MQEKTKNELFEKVADYYKDKYPTLINMDDNSITIRAYKDYMHPMLINFINSSAIVFYTGPISSPVEYTNINADELINKIDEGIKNTNEKIKLFKSFLKDIDFYLSNNTTNDYITKINFEDLKMYIRIPYNDSNLIVVSPSFTVWSDYPIYAIINTIDGKHPFRINLTNVDIDYVVEIIDFFL